MIERYETSHLIHVKSVRGLGMTLLPKLLGRGLVLLMLCGGNLAQTTYAQDESKIAEPSGKSVDYLKEIKPLLRDKCFSCHSSRKQEGGLRLDAASLIRKGGDSGPAYIAPSIGKSLLLKRVTDDDDNRMPPAEDGARLTAKEVAKLSAWIDAGSPAPDEVIPEAPSRHWAFLSPVKAEAPSISADWIRSDIDRFLAAEHQRIGVTAVGETSRSMLLRRASLALTGLPPTPAERRVFLDDKSEEAFENAVDRLLESPRYGERWARHFMDIWRYSDPSGYGKEIRDSRQHIWRWRDWIVESVNEDKGYDQMIVEMLAADEASPEDQTALRATGFLARNWYKFNRNVWLDNIVEHSSKAFLGLTVNCARCHDHKYDPFEQTGYYQMRAIFETHDIRDEPLQLASAGSKNEMLVRAYDAHLDRKTYTFLLGDENRPSKDSLTPGLPELFGELSVKPIPLSVTTWYPALRKENRDMTLQAARVEIAAAETGLKNARTALADSRQKLAKFQEPAPGPNDPPTKTIPKKSAGPSTSVLSDDFSKLNPAQWKVESGTWSVKDGRLVQSAGATKQHRLVSTINHPRDFRAKLRLRITGGDMWRSVGLGFDGDGVAMNAVYLSVSGTKVQFTSQSSNGVWQYPTVGMARHAINVGQDYELELAVKDQLLNVLIDGELKMAYKLPQRKAGHISVWAFSATAEFDQLDVTTLTPETQLEPAAGDSATPPKLLTRKDLQQSLKLSEAVEKVAVAHQDATQSILAALEARIAAETVKFGLAEGNIDTLAVIAGRASRQHAIHQLSEQIAQAQLGIEQARQKQETASTQAKATVDLQAAEKQFKDLQQKLTTAKGQLNSGSSQYPTLGPQNSKTSSGRRLAFARWITDRNNPLAARILVNHVWLRHFDAPLVERTFDFGLRSEKPRHVALLDWLAVQFMEDGWSLKKLHKRIVMSGVYRMSSAVGEASAATQLVDPDNHTLWRMNARRMEAEVVRDSVLSLGGSLDLAMGGPPIEHTQGQISLRRSLYFRQDKERQMTFLSVFDGAKVNECYQRKSTVAPQQALAMFNSQIAAAQVQKIAETYHTLNGSELVKSLFEHILGREPTPEEQIECTQFLTEFAGNAKARRQLALVLLNHNDFITIR